MSFASDLLDLRAKRKDETRNERASRNALEYRDGYAAGRGDYTHFRPAKDLDDVPAISPLQLAGYKQGYKDASRGNAERFPGHPVPANFGGAA